MSGKVTQVFPTPIYYDPRAAEPTLNATLADTIRTLAANNKSDDSFRAHRGGYYSPGTFFDSNLPGVAGARAVVQNGLQAFFNELGVAPTIERVELQSWVALTRAGDYQTPHVHGGSMLSGVYYCVMPDAPEPEGCIDFITPIDAQEMTFLKGLSRSFCRVKPVEGSLAIFPSYLRHYTHPFQSGGDRICVVFNAVVRQRPRTGEPA